MSFWETISDFLFAPNQARNFILSILCTLIKFGYGFLFGAFVWYVMVHPYARYFNIEEVSYIPEFIFCLIIATSFMVFLSARTVMILFLPSMIGNATQNYIIILLFMSLFLNPVANITTNSIESVRVIGCSLMMTFDYLKERGRLLLNPIIAILSNTNDGDLEPIKDDLLNIEKTILDMGVEAELNRDLSSNEMLEDDYATKVNGETSLKEIEDDVKSRISLSNMKNKTTEELANKTLELLSNSSIPTTIGFDKEKFGLKIVLDVTDLRKYLNNSDMIRRLNKTSSSLNSNKGFNLTEIIYNNCLGIFKKAKLSCEIAVEEMRQSCQNSIGTIFSTIWCSPITLTLTKICPWLMDQIVDENNLCSQLKTINTTSELKLIDPFNITNGSGDVNLLYRNLTKQLISLNEDLLSNEDNKSRLSNRFELDIAFNSEIKRIFSSINNLIEFIGDKYRMRKLFLDFLLFFYDLYTTITFLCIIRQAYIYRRNYLTQIRFDNHYITGEFFKLDNKRKALKKQTLLPLTKEESRHFITTFNCSRRTQEEQTTQKINCTSIIIFSILTVSIIYFDDIFKSILISIQEHGLIRYKEIGQHKLNVTVFGDGSIARVVRKLTNPLNSVYDLEKYKSTKRCLPQVHKTSYKFYLEFFYLSSLYLFIDQISIYAMRFRHITMAIFYPDKEAQRVRFLYNLMLIQRKNLSRLGVKSYLDEVENISISNDENIYTLRDATKYMFNCIRDSWCLKFCKGSTCLSKR